MPIRILVLFSMIVGLQATVPVAAESGEPAASVPKILETTARHRQASRMVSRFVEREHYSRTTIDDTLSAAVLDNYIAALDSNRHYFLRSDINYFARYRSSLDDVVRSGQLDPAFDIFRLYRLRAQQHLSYALSLLDEDMDFLSDGSYQFDREDEPWLETAAEMQALWRARVINDALSLVLADQTEDEAVEKLRKRYQRVLNRINKLDSDDVFETFLNSFARTLDPHSSYLSPRQSEEYKIQMTLSYQGIGASLRLEEDLVEVMSIIPGGPAFVDGRLGPEDRITAVAQGDDEMVEVIGWELDDVVQLIRGPKGTTVRLAVLPSNSLPGSEQRVIELIRDEVKLEDQAASSERFNLEREGRSLSVGVISVPSFYLDYDAQNRGAKDFKSTTTDVQRLIAELEEDGIDGLIVDLRGNGGGHLKEARSLTGLFIDDGPIVQLKYANGRVEVLGDPVPSSVYDGPLVVLVDRFSASASEIFAAAIQDYRRGIVIGQRTFGKGTVQNLYPLDQRAGGRRIPEPGLGQLTVTIGKYYRVTGGSTQHRGVLPDIDLPAIVDAEIIGESSRKRALPWDQIAATVFDADSPLDTEIARLSQSQRQRLTDDPDVRFLLSDIAANEELRAQKELSLNLEKRREQREQRRTEQLARENQRRTARGLPVVESLDDIEEEEKIDVLLDQATRIVGDLAGLKNSSGATISRVTDG